MKKFVLYAEDDENDAFLVQHAFKQAGAPGLVTVAPDGQSAIDFLASAVREGQPMPALILIDLNMPGKSGFDVLKWMRAEPRCRCIPAVVLSSSSHDSDVQRSYQMGANAYLVKPSNPQEMQQLAAALHTFWLGYNLFAETRVSS